MRLKDLKETTISNEETRKSLYPRLLLSRNCGKTQEKDEEQEFFAEILGLLRSTLFEIFEKPDFFKQILQKLPQNSDNLDYFLENFIVNPAETSDFAPISLLSSLFRDISPKSADFRATFCAPMRFLQVFCRESSEIQRFSFKKFEKLLDFCAKHRENLEIDATKIKEIFKNKVSANVHHTHPGFDVVNKFKPDFVDFDLLELAPLASKTVVFPSNSKDFQGEVANFELNLSEDSESQEKSSENEENSLKDPQMLRFRRKNVEIVKKAVEILWEIFRECSKEMPIFVKKMLKSLISGEIIGKKEIFVSVLLDFCVFQHFLREFERISAEKAAKCNISSIITVVKSIFEGKSPGFCEDFEEFIEQKREELGEICEKIDENLKENAERHENIEKTSINITSFLINIENIDKLMGLMQENEEFFLAKSSRLVKNCKTFEFSLVFLKKFIIAFTNTSEKTDC